jgi:hypothetical protein
MYILLKQRELSKQINIHEIAENFLEETLHQILFFFFVENKSRKTTKTCYTGKEMKFEIDF